MHNGWPSPYIPVLEMGNYSIQITSEESSYLVVTPQIGEIAGAIICLLAVDIVGRKMMIIFTASLFIISWIILGLAATPTLMFASRFLAGVSCLISFATGVMYLAEITNPTARAFLVTLSGTSFAIGDLVIYVIGAFVPLDTAAFICACIPLLYLVTFCWMPESPYFYLMRNKEEQARKCLQILRGQTDVNKEFEGMSAAVKEQNESKKKWLDVFTVKSFRRALIIGLGRYVENMRSVP